MATINKLSEQVQRIVSRYVDRENTKPIADTREIKLLVNQALNEVLKAETMSGMRLGMIEIPACMVITYEDLTVTSDPSGDLAYVTLPAMPISLPKNMGVWSVVKSTSPLSSYIPIPTEFAEMMGTTNVSYLEQQVGFYVYGKKLYFTKDITGASYGSVTQVNVKMLTSDFSQFTGTELLPINADFEAPVIYRTIELLGAGRITMEQIQQEIANEKV